MKVTSLLFVILAIGQLESSFGDAITYSPIVQLSSGKVRGFVERLDEQHSVYAYQGIRYGQAARFAKPKPADKWTGVYDAVKSRDSCPQFGVSHEANWIGNYTESEDCLYVNVWKPADEKKNRTVMVWIHGGGYQNGGIFAEGFDGRYFASQADVVMVTLAYRLGALGFLRAGNDYAGNWGLHDQVLALKWVQKNIVHFGGNPGDVTIYGESAGSWSVGSLIVTPLTKGLFKRAIMQSGSPTSATDNPDWALVKAKDFAAKAGCEWPNEEQAIKCLRTKSVAQLTGASLQGYMVLQPVYGDEFFPISPFEAAKTGKFNHGIDLIFGVVSNEGSLFVTGIIANRIKTSKSLSLQTTKEDILFTMKQFGLSYGGEVADFYMSRLGANASQDELKTLLSTMMSDFFFNCPETLFVEAMAKAQPNGVHYYSYRVVQNAWKQKEAWMGVPHGSEVQFVFPSETFLKQADEGARKLSHDMVQAWASFAKTGSPGAMGTVKWVEAFVDKTNPVTRHISLHSANYTMVDAFYKQTCQGFWKAKLFA